MEKKKEPLQKLAFAWVFLIVIIVVFLLLFFIKPSRCVSTNFLCNKLSIEDNHAKINLVNTLYELDMINLSASCNVEKWFFNERYDYVTFELNKNLQIDVFCKDYFKNLNITLLYKDTNTNITHTDIIIVKR